jgi:hydrogenase maturation protease
MSGIVVIGCGNLYATDDAVGLYVIRTLRKCQSLPSGVKLIEAGTLGLNLLDLWDKTDCVIIVDAVVTGAEPGSVHCFTADCLPLRQQMPVSLHGVNVIDALALAAIMGQMPASLKIVGVEILSEEPYREGLTPDVAVAIPVACARVLNEIKGG